MPSVKDLTKLKHPCFNNKAHAKIARVHLPVAPKCQLTCAYCQRGFSRLANVPGQTRTLLKPREAVAYLKPKLKLFPTAVIGIAGPGDPLATADALLALKLIKKAFPGYKKCLCTNGLYLAEKISELIKVGISYVSVTINALTAQTASFFYHQVIYKGQRLTGLKACELVINKQWEGLYKAVQAGLHAKINTVFVPEINKSELVKIAQKGALAGVKVMNIIPLMPGAKMKNLRPPTDDELEQMRIACTPYLPQFTHCRHCRADAWGKLPKRQLRVKDN